MKKLYCLLGCLCFLTPKAAQAQDNSSFYQDIMFTEEVNLDEKVDTAEAQAKKILNTKPRTLRKNKFPELRKTTQPRKKTTSNAAQEAPSAAPFGLTWGATISETKDLGVIITPFGEKDYVNSFTATHLPKNINDFNRVEITFGKENELWRILAYGKFMEDDSKASKVMNLYRIYYQLLNKKYGNAKQFFIPKTSEIEKKDKQGKVVKEKIEQPMGGEGFLQSLQNGEATLYATFQSQEVGAALAVNVDGDGKSYIVIDYKNLKILQAREKKALEAL